MSLIVAIKTEQGIVMGCDSQVSFGNNKYRLTERIDSGGGSASNAAYLLGKWGIETHMAGGMAKNDNNLIIPAA